MNTLNEAEGKGVPIMKQISGLAKAGYFLIGLFGGLPGVLFLWFVGKDGWGWSEGGKLWAWLGCLFFIILGLIMRVSGGLLSLIAVLTGNGTVTVS